MEGGVYMLEGQRTLPGVLTLSSHYPVFDYVMLLLLLMWKLKLREAWGLLRGSSKAEVPRPHTRPLSQVFCPSLQAHEEPLPYNCHPSLPLAS